MTVAPRAADRRAHSPIALVDVNSIHRKALSANYLQVTTSASIKRGVVSLT